MSILHIIPLTRNLINQTQAIQSKSSIHNGIFHKRPVAFQGLNLLVINQRVHLKEPARDYWQSGQNYSQRTNGHQGSHRA